MLILLCGIGNRYNSSCRGQTQKYTKSDRPHHPILAPPFPSQPLLSRPLPALAAYSVRAKAVDDTTRYESREKELSIQKDIAVAVLHAEQSANANAKRAGVQAQAQLQEQLKAARSETFASTYSFHRYLAPAIP